MKDAKIIAGTNLQTQQAQAQKDSRLLGENVNEGGRNVIKRRRLKGRWRLTV